MSSRIVMQTFVIWFSKNNKSPATARFDPLINFFEICRIELKKF